MNDGLQIASIFGSALGSAGLVYLITKTPAHRSSVEDIIEAYPRAEPIAQNIVELADEMGMPDPGWLANLIRFETGGRFSPSIQNPSTRATGLIQFMPSTAEGMGTTVERLAQMSAKSQWYYVRKYMLKKLRYLPEGKRKFTEPTDVYMAVFYPWAIGKGRDVSLAEHWASRRSGRSKETFIRQNGGIETAQDYADYANKNAKLPTGKYLSKQKLARNIGLGVSAASLATISIYLTYDYLTGDT